MIVIERLRDFSGLDSEARERAEESFGVWRVRYGGDNEYADHTDLLYFGAVVVSATRKHAVLWAEVQPSAARLPVAAQRAARRAFRAFCNSSDAGWRLFALCAAPREARFLRFIGFKEITTVDNDRVFEGVF